MSQTLPAEWPHQGTTGNRLEGMCCGHGMGHAVTNRTYTVHRKSVKAEWVNMPVMDHKANNKKVKEGPLVHERCVNVCRNVVCKHV